MSADSTSTDKPTIVLVHGAFADASSWNGVAQLLQQDGYTVVAPANPLRGISADSAYIASVLDQIDGPVLLVGHSYGGAVNSNAATDAPNVIGLVYVAAFAPDEGEKLIEVENGSKDSILDSASGPAPVSDGPGRRDGGRVRDQPGALPRVVRGRSLRGGGSPDGGDPAAGR